MKYIFLSLSCLFMFFETNAQVDLGYQTPHGDILELADAERPPSLRLNTDGDQGFMLYRNSYKTIAELSETELRLAGLRINPTTNISSRQTYYYKITLFDVGSGEESAVKGLPENPKLANFRFSNDDSKLAFTHTTKKGVELWVLDMKTNAAKRIVEDRINANMGSPFAWFKDDQSILVKLLPSKRPNLIDKSKAIPNGPTVSENAGSKAQNRTYQDLLKNPNDEKNFETLAQSELWKVNLKGEKSLWKKNAMHRGISFSPDGNFILLTTIHRPFSYIVTYSRFPSQTTVFDTDGNNIKTILETPLIEELPKGFMAVRKGPRSISWRADKGAVLYWVEALDGGDPAKEVAHRDAVYQLEAPFLKGQKKLVTKTLYFVYR